MSRIWSARGPACGSTTLVAPSSVASVRLLSCRSTAMTDAASRTTAAITADRPTAPAPVMTTVDPGWTSSEFNTAPAPVWMPQPSGPTSSTGAPGGSLTTLRSRASACVANDDWPKKLLPNLVPAEASPEDPSGRTPPKLYSRKPWQYAGCPFAHCGHEAQLLKLIATESPTESVFTSDPTDTT